MKKHYKINEVDAKSQEWIDQTKHTPWMQSDIVLQVTSAEHNVKTIISTDYCCCEYKMKLNLLTFGKFKIQLPFRVIAPPISVDAKGYIGNLDNLIADYKREKGLFLILNLDAKDLPVNKNKFAFGKTLPSCIFKNDFNSFEDYLLKLRSSYRRRINIAITKGKSLAIKKIENGSFDDNLYGLYLQVLSKSDFSLETLPKNFFVNSSCDIYTFSNEETVIAFIMISNQDNCTNFIFGGMDYSHRDKYDTYYNMLLQVIKIGIRAKSTYINFGQTAEDTKCRLGCGTENRYMIGFSNIKMITNILRIGTTILENKKTFKYNVFKI